jgi:DNA polymerase III gamma/tau subunit
MARTKQQNIDAFKVWMATQTDDDYKQIAFGGQLLRREIAKAVGCGKSALNQNKDIRTLLKTLEESLRDKGVLPQLTDTAKKDADKPKQYDNTASRKALDSRRLSSLEAENIELKAKLKRYGELSETLSEMGFIPR